MCRFYYDDWVHIVSDIDGVRLLTNDTSEFLQKVPGELGPPDFPTHTERDLQKSAMQYFVLDRPPRHQSSSMQLSNWRKVYQEPTRIFS